MEHLRERTRHDEAQALYHAKQEARSERNIEIAQKALQKKMSIQDIMDITGLTYAETENLQKGMK